MKLSIVIPCYNESEKIERALKSISSYCQANYSDYEIIVSDDGSHDDTRDKVEVLNKNDSNIHLLANDHKGKGYALRKGVEYASGDYIYLCDVDLAAPIESLGLFIAKAQEGFDVVIGSREGFLAKRIGEPFYRHIMGRGFNLLVQFLLLPGIQDTQCGFKLFTKEAAKKLFSKQMLYGEHSPILNTSALTAYDVEILFLAKKYHLRVFELPLEWKFHETKHVSVLRDSLRNLRDVLKVRFHDISGHYHS